MLTLLLYILSVLIPIVLWFSFFLWKDRADPGPKRLMLLIFILGIGMAFLAGAVNSLVSYFVLGGSSLQATIEAGAKFSFAIVVVIVIASILEETWKYLTLREFLYERVQFNQVADGVFYGVTLALGFSLIENTNYFFLILRMHPEGYMPFLIYRALFCVLLHITTAGYFGYYLGKRKYSLEHSRKYLYISLLIAFSLHITFNLFSFYSLVVVIPAFVFLVIKMTRPENLAIWKLVEVRDGDSNVYPKSDS